MAYAGDILDTIAGINLVEIIHETLIENTGTMADLNAAQLAQGLNSDNTAIEPPYKDVTVFEKQQKSGLAGVTDHVTLYNEGDHYREMYAEVDGDDAFELGSKDAKSDKLQKKYGKKIYGLTDDSKEILKDDFTLPAFQKKVEAKTGLKFI